MNTVTFAVNAPATWPVSPRGHRPPDGAVTGRVHLPCPYDPPDARLGAFTERLLVEHVRSGHRPRRRLARLFGLARTPADGPGRERRLRPGREVRALTARGR